eukprot:687123-Rhodomonas_salina.1
MREGIAARFVPGKAAVQAVGAYPGADLRVRRQPTSVEVQWLTSMQCATASIPARITDSTALAHPPLVS